MRSFETAAAALAVKSVLAAVHSTAEIEDAVSALGREPHAGLAVMPDVSSTLHRGLIASLAAQYRVPAIYPYRYFVISGGLISYGIDIVELYRGAVSYVNRVLRGEKLAELPVQAPTHCGPDRVLRRFGIVRTRNWSIDEVLAHLLHSGRRIPLR
jgi:putative tryptophan/tyrosine transport system substrate-binding protein